ncbi:MAG: putative thiamine ABC-transporter ATP-binding protein [Ilumatobacteraceae bacterium]|nr:putative thiamine ABC-transporter ATP-binding protein [Ilumatobacteraceae bacterium]
MLELRDLTVRFGDRTIVDELSIAVGAGEVIALVGPSGSGKSTVLRVIAGLLQPDAGTLVIGGRDVSTLPAHLRRVGMVFQDDQLFPHLDVAGNVAFGLRMRHDPRRTVDRRVAEVLQLVGLAGFGPRRVGRLSGGEAKRVALARSLAPSPAVLLLDEPLTGLDRELHDRLVVDLAALLRETGTTAVLVTHDLEEAAAIADRVVRLPNIDGAEPH